MSEVDQPSTLPTEEHKLDPDVKAKWLAALRSGKYSQGSGALRTAGNAYCCLGVLADIVSPEEWSDEPDDNLGTITESIECYTHDGCTEMLDIRMLEKLHLRWTASRLAVMNDGDESQGLKQFSFAEIADWIEKNL